MARHRSPGRTAAGSPSGPAAEQPSILELAIAAYGGQAGAVSHRARARARSIRTRVALAAVAAGAAVTAGQTLGADIGASAATHDVALAAGTGAPPALSSAAAQAIPAAVVPEALPAAVPNVLPIAKAADVTAAEQLAKSGQMTAERATRAAEARRPLYVMPAAGQFTSGYGERWGAMHAGVDIANAIGTPIGSVSDGVVIEAGPASGFGLWVRVQNNDGTISVYGHVNEIIAKVGQKVRAGEEIATIGNRGESTGPHLHLEVWLNGNKIDPQPWLASHGIVLK